MNEDEYGYCPNCGRGPLHITDLGEENSIICCGQCVESLTDINSIKTKDVTQLIKLNHFY